MTHSLHRRGVVDDLKKDYVVLAQLAMGINNNPKFRKKFLKIGEIFNDNDPKSIMNRLGWNASSTITASYDQLSNVQRILSKLKDKDYGISIVVSGLRSEIHNMLKEINLKPHTVHLFLGTFGKKDRLPKEEILEITTLCGHHCIAPRSVENFINQLKGGKISIEEAAQRISKPCVCGIVNTTRVKDVLSRIIYEENKTK